MDIALIIFMAVGLMLNGIVLGVVIPLVNALNLQKKAITKKVDEFDEITKKASEANLSLANKILQLEEKVSNFEFWKSNSSFKSK